MSKPSYVKIETPGEKPEAVFVRQPLTLPPNLDEAALKAYSHLRYLFSRFSLIDKHEAEVGRLQNITDYKLSDKTRRSLTNKTRREIGPTAVLAASLLFEKAFKADQVNPDNLWFVRQCQNIVKAFQQDASFRDLLRPYTLEPSDDTAIRQTTKTPCLPELRAAIATNVACLTFDITQGHCKGGRQQQQEFLEFAKVQWEIVDLFLSWKKELGLEQFALLDVNGVKKHIERLSSFLTYYSQS